MPGAWRKALHATTDGCFIDLELQPGADRDQVPSGYNAWRGRIQARVRAPPHEGAANDALQDRLATTLRIPRANLQLVDGHTSRRKRVRVTGLTSDDVAQRFAEVLDGS
ncbi:MAG TPA: DUF167 domain-containing protein [Candidatus Thermoplasmatota archaeon]|nr:DUF167 domain-containing protein [Candidatus Thermoplasmatota archaeon]